MDVILAYGKYGTEPYATALGLLHARVEDGYWYDDEPRTRRSGDTLSDAQVAQRILAAADEARAWRFLRSRSDHEYEGVDKVRVGP